MISVELVKALSLCVKNGFLSPVEIHEYLKQQMYPKEPFPDLLDNTRGLENTIEKEELEEQSLDDLPRIPMKQGGINLQFEGEEEIMPIDIH